MQAVKSISIPTPCHESWDTMATVEQGRHCRACEKTVVDFNAMSNAGVIAYLASHKNACGRIDNSKLAAINYQLELQDKKQPSWKGLFAAASLSMLFPTVNAAAQTRPATEQMPYSSLSPGAKLAAHVPGTITVMGRVTSADDGLPTPGASIVIKGTTTGTQTDADGSFKLMVLNAGDTLLISSVGYKQIETPVGHGSKNMAIKLQWATVALNDVCVSGYGASIRHDIVGGVISVVNLKKLPFYLRWWYWLVHQVKHVAHAITHL